LTLFFGVVIEEFPAAGEALPQAEPTGNALAISVQAACIQRSRAFPEKGLQSLVVREWSTPGKRQ
jgi:hypothetical protein